VEHANILLKKGKLYIQEGGQTKTIKKKQGKKIRIRKSKKNGSRRVLWELSLLIVVSSASSFDKA